MCHCWLKDGVKQAEWPDFQLDCSGENEPSVALELDRIVAGQANVSLRIRDIFM